MQQQQSFEDAPPTLRQPQAQAQPQSMSTAAAAGLPYRSNGNGSSITSSNNRIQTIAHQQQQQQQSTNGMIHNAYLSSSQLGVASTMTGIVSMGSADGGDLGASQYLRPHPGTQQHQQPGVGYGDGVNMMNLAPQQQLQLMQAQQQQQQQLGPQGMQTLPGQSHYFIAQQPQQQQQSQQTLAMHQMGPPNQNVFIDPSLYYRLRKYIFAHDLSSVPLLTYCVLYRSGSESKYLSIGGDVWHTSSPHRWHCCGECV